MRLGDVSGVAAVANGEVERAGAGNGDDGCSALRWPLAGEEGGRGEAKMERGATRADAGGVKATPRRVVACTVRALATRGRHRGHAARKLCRWSATEANVPDLIQFIRNAMAT